MKFKFLFEENVVSIYGILKAKARDLGIWFSDKHNDQLRVECRTGDPTNTLDIFLGKGNYECGEPIFDLGISGTYYNYNVTITTDITIQYNNIPYKRKSSYEIKSGTTFIFVPAIKQKGKFRTKTLTPAEILGKSGIGLNSRYTREKLYEIALKNVYEKFDETPERKFMVELLKFGAGIDFEFDKESIRTIAPEDIKTILKDFGEIICALKSFDIEYNKRKEVKYVAFPSNSNENLTDFYGFDSKETMQKYSVKSGVKNASELGAAASVTNLREIANEFKDSKYQKLFDIFTGKGPILDRIINVAYELANENIIDENIAIKPLEKIIGNKPLTVEALNKYCEEHIDDLTSILNDNFYSKIERNFKTSSIDQAKKKKLKNYAGFVLSPLAYYIIKIVNNQTDFIEELTEAIKNINLTQANIIFSPSDDKPDIKFIYVEKAEFDKEAIDDTFKNNSTFDVKLDYHANALSANNNNFGFKIIAKEVIV